MIANNLCPRKGEREVKPTPKNSATFTSRFKTSRENVGYMNRGKTRQTIDL